MIEVRLTEQLRTEVKRIALQTEAAWRDFTTIFRQQRFGVGERVALPGDEVSGFYFVCSGLLRYYFIADDGNEWNKAFVSEGTLAASFSEDFLGYPSPYGIQALESAVLLMARYCDFEALYERHPSIERLGRRFVEQVLAVKLARERSFLQHDATSRYCDFVGQYPELTRRIPQYHLASYLGVSEVTLSRLRGQRHKAGDDDKQS